VSGDKWAKVPHALILDGRVSAGAIRLYARLCNYQFAYQRWHKALPKDLRLANDLDTSTRNIRRWRKELVATGWAAFEYHGTVLAGLTLMTGRNCPRTNLSVSYGPMTGLTLILRPNLSYQMTRNPRSHLWKQAGMRVSIQFLHRRMRGRG
jgi:hypothetical protein